ncbi:MAG: baseplate J/gp47 family protein, partial [Campylobacterales bacterium]|nr:baseplate J/gp47 family protein [Campylobacterales bacterium]
MTFDDNIQEPVFIETDPVAIEAALVTKYETLTGKKLYPAQQERLMLNVIAYAKTLTHIGINEASKQNLVRYAAFPMLDHLGDFHDITRLAAISAMTTMRFSMTEAKSFIVTIDAGTEVESKDGKVIFVTQSDATIEIGNTYVDVIAYASEAGEIGNGYTAGEINTPIAPIAFIDSAANITTTNSGTADESDERYRNRWALSVNKYSTAGADDSYKYHAYSAHPDIVSVEVDSPLVDGKPSLEVDVYVLTSSGAPSAEIKAAVESILSAKKVRPLNDYVVVKDPEEIQFSIIGSVVMYESADSDTVLASIQTALSEYTAELRKALGNDIVPSKIIGVIQAINGVHKVELSSPLFTELNLTQW